MPEVPDVVTLTTISTDWGNDIRDRTLQRYASVAARSAAHSAPVEGDLSYLQDTNTVWVYDGSAWVNIAKPVQTADLADDAVTTAKIAPEAITSAELGPSSVVNSRIADAVVSGAKMQGVFLASFEVDGSSEVTIYALTASYANAASVALTIPTGWGSWKCEAYATFAQTGGTSSRYSVRMSIDGTAQQEQTAIRQEDGLVRPGSAIGGRRSGMVTTGSRTIALQAVRTSGTDGSLNDIYLYARAIRTS